MRFRIFFTSLALIAASLTWAVESNQSSLQSLRTSQSTNPLTRIKLIDSGEYHSQADQDRFVYMILYGLLGKQDQGYYLEIGSGDPIDINNSYFFEKQLQWNGISIDISQNYTTQWRAIRKNTLLNEDALKADYEAILQFFPKTIDYLSLDVDGHYADVLKRIPLRDYTFKVITIEHDFYRFGDVYRSEERQILESFGYHLLCADVFSNGLCFEDWWIHPSFFSPSQLALISSLDLDGKDNREIIETLRAALSK